jgi:glucose/mannose-6-phosphate isomerase
MLDDLKLIHSRDVQDALGVISKQLNQLDHVFDTDLSVIDSAAIHNIVVAGMGGSALAAGLAQSWPNVNKPFQVVRDYNIPPYANKNTLFIASSYSGNTEETVQALAQAQHAGCQIAVIAAGGKLAKIAQENQYPLCLLPSGYQPRMAVMYNFAALLAIFSATNLAISNLEELHEAIEWLKNESASWLPNIPTAHNPAKQLAQELVGNSIVVYSGPKLYPAAYKWKINFNENAKHVAWCNQYPEFNHNEFLGWTKQPPQKPYKIIELHASIENDRIQKRMEISDRLLSGMRPSPEKVIVQGDTLIQQLLWALLFGDFVSLYLALLNGINPTPVEIIEKLKQQLA